MTPIYKNCDHRLQFTGVRGPDDEIIEDGTCTYTLTRESDETVISSGSLPFISGTEGDYWVTVDKTVTALVTEDERYQIKVVFTDPDGNDFEGYMDLYGDKRRF